MISLVIPVYNEINLLDKLFNRTITALSSITDNFEIICVDDGSTDNSLEKFGYDGLELACWGDHFEVDKADEAYCKAKKEILDSYGLEVYAISNHLVGQAVCDNIDDRHKSILPAYVWGDGDPEGVRQRAAKEMIEK